MTRAPGDSARVEIGQRWLYDGFVYEVASLQSPFARWPFLLISVAPRALGQRSYRVEDADWFQSAKQVEDVSAAGAEEE